MEAGKPTLPDAKAVAESIKKWTATQPAFAVKLKNGVAPVTALTRWSLELLKAKQFTEAVAVLRSAVTLAPSDPNLWANFGIALQQSGSSEEAVACLEHSLTLSKQQPNTWLMLGLARKKLGNLPGAEMAYHVALEQEPNSSAAWQLLAVLKEEQKDFAAAVECLGACIKTGGPSAAILANLGKLNNQLGRIAESQQAYREATEMDPDNTHYRHMARKANFLRESLQNESIDIAIANFQNSFGRSDVYSEKELKELLQSSFSFLSGFGHIEAAMRVGKKQGELWPAGASLTYLLGAVAGDQTIDRSPPEYVVEYFDSFAAGFDAQLVDVLGYDVPEKLCDAIRLFTAPEQPRETLDAGCGTGLCGPFLRPFSRTLTGVDLSSKMLEQAGRKGVYDTLVCEELTTFLSRSANQFDLIVAADLLIYFGDLTALFQAVETALKPEGLFAFSAESWIGAGYRILPSGRFAHAPDYVRQIAAGKFTELSQVETTIRLDATERVVGSLFIFRRSC